MSFTFISFVRSIDQTMIPRTTQLDLVVFLRCTRISFWPQDVIQLRRRPFVPKTLCVKTSSLRSSQLPCRDSLAVELLYDLVPRRFLKPPGSATHPCQHCGPHISCISLSSSSPVRSNPNSTLKIASDAEASNSFSTTFVQTHLPHFPTIVVFFRVFDRVGSIEDHSAAVHLSSDLHAFCTIQKRTETARVLPKPQP